MFVDFEPFILYGNVGPTSIVSNTTTLNPVLAKLLHLLALHNDQPPIIASRTTYVAYYYRVMASNMDFNTNMCIEMKRNEKYGRYCVANRSIRKGELILCENYLFVVPNFDSKLCCWNCNDKFDRVCVKCKVVPFCKVCRTHPIQECNYLIGRNLPEQFLVDHPLLMLPLKCILSVLSENTKDYLTALMEMETHLDKRDVGSQKWKFVDGNIVQPLKRFEVFDENIIRTAKIDDEFIQKMCAIFDVNGLDVRGQNEMIGFADGVELRAVYPMTVYLSHSCCNNILLTIDSSYMMRIYASRDIEPGEIICYSYTDILINTQERQNLLYTGKYFKCDCSRCLDPTENGTHFSSIKCRSCAEGYCVPVYTSNNDTTESKCNECNSILSKKDIDHILRIARGKLTKDNGDLFAMEKLLIKLKQLLNPNHSYVLELKQEIASLLRDMCAHDIPSREILTRKYELCSEVLAILRKLQPGISRLVGIALYETYTPIMRLAEYDIEEQKITINEFLKRLIGGECLLKEVISHLRYEDASVPEGKLAKQAMNELKELQNAIRGVQICLGS